MRRKLRRLVGLDRISLGIQGEFQYRTSAEFFAPTFGIVGRAWLDEYNAGMRSGQRYSVGAESAPVAHRSHSFLRCAGANSRNADSASSTAGITPRDSIWTIRSSRDGTLYLGGEYRRGDTVTSAPDSAAYEAIAKADAPDDAYADRGFVAYRYEAKTVLWTLGYNRRLGPNDSIDLWWRRAESTPTATRPPRHLALLRESVFDCLPDPLLAKGLLRPFNTRGADRRNRLSEI
jgi:hypothetical protein